MSFTITESAAKMRQKANRLAAKRLRGLKRQLLLEANAIMTDSKKNYAPVKEGHLRNAGWVGKVEEEGNSLVISFGYGGFPHIIAAHETPSQHDPPTWKGKVVKFNRGGRKFLFLPLMKRAHGGMQERLAKAADGES